MRGAVAAVALLLAAPALAAPLLEGEWRVAARCGDDHEAEGSFALEGSADLAEGPLLRFDEYDHDIARARRMADGGVVLEFFRRVDDAGVRCTGEACQYRDLIAMELAFTDADTMAGTYNRWRWFATVTCQVTARRVPARGR